MHEFAIYCSEKHDNGYGEIWGKEEYVGNTRAVSPAQAITNIRYRRGEIGCGKRSDNGRPVIRSYRAVLV